MTGTWANSDAAVAGRNPGVGRKGRVLARTHGSGAADGAGPRGDQSQRRAPGLQDHGLRQVEVRGGPQEEGGAQEPGAHAAQGGEVPREHRRGRLPAQDAQHPGVPRGRQHGQAHADVPRARERPQGDRRGAPQARLRGARRRGERRAGAEGRRPQRHRHPSTNLPQRCLRPLWHWPRPCPSHLSHHRLR